MNVALLVIAKSPVPGKVKTRLCPPCTAEQAAAIAQAALRETLATVAEVPASRRVVVLDGAPGPWLPPGFDVVPQCQGPLDERLAGAFESIGGPAFLVGMDTPHVAVGQIAAATRQLREPDVDAVLGPAVDGGWWGIGLRHGDGSVFRGVPMSTTQTVAYQLRRMHALGLRTRVIDQLRDVDVFDDALASAACIPHSAFAAAVAAVTREQPRELAVTK
jgi:rSAM/selenodomain-associated transferase 1